MNKSNVIQNGIFVEVMSHFQSLFLFKFDSIDLGLKYLGYFLIMHLSSRGALLSLTHGWDLVLLGKLVIDKVSC